MIMISGRQEGLAISEKFETHGRLAVKLYGRVEIRLTSDAVYSNPIQDVQVAVRFSCGTANQIVDSFWDGGLTWLARFSPEVVGRWEWHTSCSNKDDTGLNERAGQFVCEEDPGSLGLFLHGPLRVSNDRTHLSHRDGTPFFWLGDTAWNGPLKASEPDWLTYLDNRAALGFTAIQFVATQWIGAAADAEGRPAYLGREKIRIEPAFFRRLDKRVDAINAFGMVAAPVLAWAAGWNAESAHLNPGNTLSEEQLVLLVRYIVARYGAHQAVWILAGDGIYEGEEAARWRRIGRAALDHTTKPATMHPGGRIWVAGEFRHEPWFSFNSYQSGHWNDEDNARWINEGPPSQDWRSEPRCPQINLEPAYEGHKAFSDGKAIDAHAVRRACYWSLLATPTAGVSYGAHGIWSWESVPEVPLSHPDAGIAPSWKEAMWFAGAAQMAHLKALFSSIEWWRLRPCPELLTSQPGTDHPNRFLACACSENEKVTVIYAPEGGEIPLIHEVGKPEMIVSCFDPAVGAELWRRRLKDVSPLDSGGPGDRLVILQDEADAAL